MRTDDKRISGYQKRDKELKLTPYGEKWKRLAEELSRLDTRPVRRELVKTYLTCLTLQQVSATELLKLDPIGPSLPMQLEAEAILRSVKAFYEAAGVLYQLVEQTTRTGQ